MSWVMSMGHETGKLGADLLLIFIEANDILFISFSMKLEKYSP